MLNCMCNYVNIYECLHARKAWFPQKFWFLSQYLSYSSHRSLHHPSGYWELNPTSLSLWMKNTLPSVVFLKLMFIKPLSMWEASCHGLSSNSKLYFPFVFWSWVWSSPQLEYRHPARWNLHLDLNPEGNVQNQSSERLSPHSVCIKWKFVFPYVAWVHEDWSHCEYLSKLTFGFSRLLWHAS